MADILIRGVPDEVVGWLDARALREERSRTWVVKDILRAAVEGGPRPKPTLVPEHKTVDLAPADPDLKPSQRVARQNAAKAAGAPRAHVHKFVKRAGSSGALISVCSCGEVEK